MPYGLNGNRDTFVIIFNNLIYRIDLLSINFISMNIIVSIIFQWIDDNNMLYRYYTTHL